MSGPRSAPSPEAPRSRLGKADDMADDAGRMNEVLAETSFLYGGNARLRGGPLRAAGRPTRTRSSPPGAPSSPPCTTAPTTVKRAAPEPAWTPRRVARAAARLAVGASTACGRRSRPSSTAKIAERQPPAVSADAVRAATLDSPARDHDDPRLPHARPPEGQPRPAGPRHDAGRRLRARSGHLRLRREPTTTGRSSSTIVLGLETATIREILAILRRTYCGNVGVQYMHISDPDGEGLAAGAHRGPRQGDRLHPGGQDRHPEEADRDRGLRALPRTSASPAPSASASTAARAVVPALEQIIKRGGALGVKDIVIGMPHRGRLNVLAAVMGKPYQVIFHEFQGGSSLPSDIEGSGDVKYHLGASSDRAFDGNTRPPVADRQPQPPGDRQPGGARQGARQAGLHPARQRRPPAAATCCRC